MTSVAAIDDRALGTNVRVVVTRADRLAAAKRAVDRVLRDIDQACSRFRDDSELARLNARPGVETQVSPLLARAIDEGLRGARASGGVEMHHILDPRTGMPVDSPWRLASVVADTCVDANIASTAAIVRGHAAPQWLEALGLPARLVGNDGEVVRTSRWPAPEADPHL
jgi:thiamine biosynthesis lipoprotein ApbE